MADKKISELDALTGANTADDDRLVIVDTSAGLTKSITMAEFKNAFDSGSGFVRVTGDTMTGDLALSGADVTFGDNDKAIFGAGSDLQIYHDGSNSYISDQGTGNIILDADDSFQVKRGANTSAVFDTNAEVALYHNNAVKLATTSTGVDITGTLTSDSLTVDGEGIISSATTATNLSNPILQLTGSSYTANGVYGIGFNYNTDGSGTSPVFAGYQLTSGSGNTKGNLVFGTRDTTTAGDVPLIRQTIAPNGDISFYEDTGTTPKFFWDSSQETLRIGSYNGGGTPSGSLFVDSNANNHAIHIEETGGGSESWQIGVDADGDLGFYNSTSTTASVTFDDSGNVGIGTSSPAAKLDIRPANEAQNTFRIYRGIDSGYQLDYLNISQYAGDSVLNSVGSGNAEFIFQQNGTEAMRIDNSGNVGIGTSSPSRQVHISGSGVNTRLRVENTTGSNVLDVYAEDGGNSTLNYSSVITMSQSGTERMRIDSSGNLLVGTTDSIPYNNSAGTSADFGFAVNKAFGFTSASAYNNTALLLNRTSTDGDIVEFRKDGAPVGSIGAYFGNLMIGKNSGARIAFSSTGIYSSNDSGTTEDASYALGTSSSRFTDLHLSGGIEIENGTGNVGVGKQALNSNTASNNTAVGYQSLYDNTTGALNTAVGQSALFNNTTASNNTSIGRASMFDNSTGASNVAVGSGALADNTTGSFNVSLGMESMRLNTTASNNTAVGYQAAYSNTTGLLTAIGRYASRSQTTGNYNTSVGLSAAYNTTTGSSNTALGHEALNQNTTASNNTAVGYQALYDNTTGSGLVALGNRSLYENTTGTSNVASGSSSLRNNTSGNYNSAFGDSALRSNTTASRNVAVGYQTLYANTTGYENVAMGTYALDANTNGIANTAIGDAALSANTTASNNTSVGSESLKVNTTGASNTALGKQALVVNTTGVENTALGYTAGASNTTSSYSTFIGKAAGYYSTGAQSTYVGEQSGYYITSGAKNTILGRYNGNQGGLDIRTSSNNIVLADGDGNPRVNWDSDGRAQFRSTSSASAGTLNSALISGDGLGASLNIFSARPNNNAYYNFVGANVSNTVTFIVLGTGNVTNTNNSYGGISDVKLKENIVDASSQWDDIKALTVRKYSMKADELDAPNRLGVIAQEVEAAGMSGLVLENIDRDEDMHDLGTVTKTVNYSILYMKAVKALQEAMTRIETLETQNASFEARITALEGA